MTRILITGSRGWTDYAAILRAVLKHRKAGEETVIVHGACPTGADALADRMAGLHGFTKERHPAQGHPTEDFGPWPGAGPRRNAHMVSLGADVCLAFIGRCTSRRCKTKVAHPSHGAYGTAKLAQKAGIPTERHYT